jgi:cell division protein FtsB
MSDNKTLKFRPKGQVDNQSEAAEEPVYEVGDDYDHGDPGTELAAAGKPGQTASASDEQSTQTGSARKFKATPRPKATARPASARTTSATEGVRTPRSADETANLSAAKRRLDRMERRSARAARTVSATEAPAAQETGSSVPERREPASETKRERKPYQPKKSVDVGAAVSWVRDRLPKKDPDAPKVPLREKRWPRIAALVLVIVLAIGAFLYPSLKDFYTAKRNGQRYQAQLELLESNNQELSDRIAELQSKEGIMDEARRHGYVVEGETAVEVEGVDDGETDGTAAMAPDTLGTQLPDEERPWYIVALDTIFGYEAS